MAREKRQKKKRTYADISRNKVLSILVDDLVTSEKAQNIGIRFECLNNTEDLLEVDRIVRSPRLTTVQRAIVERRVDIKDHIDTSTVEVGDTLVVIERGFQVVDANSVDLSRKISWEFQILHRQYSLNM